jgi:hypothetical protein
LDLLQFTRLLQTPQRYHDRIEEIQQDQCAVLIKMQTAIPQPVTLAPVVMQPLQQRQQLPQLLGAGDFRLRHLLPSLPCHPRLPATMTSRFVAEAMAQISCQTTPEFCEAKMPAGKESGTGFDRLKPVLLQQGQHRPCRTVLGQVSRPVV